MNTAIVIQARISSTRFPGKILKKIRGQPMIWHIIARLRRVKNAHRLIIATSNNPKDKMIVDFAKKERVDFFVGSEGDVLDRIYQTAKNFNLDCIVRATADNPFVDPEEIDKLIKLHRQTKADYSLNKSDETESGLPVGVGVDIFSFSSLEKSWREGRKPNHREHVNEYILENKNVFKISILKAPREKRAPNLRLTVDTPTDLKKIRYLYNKLYHKGKIIRIEEIIKFLSFKNEGRY